MANLSVSARRAVPDTLLKAGGSFLILTLLLPWFSHRETVFLWDILPDAEPEGIILFTYPLFAGIAAWLIARRPHLPLLVRNGVTAALGLVPVIIFVAADTSLTSQAGGAMRTPDIFGVLLTLFLGHALIAVGVRLRAIDVDTRLGRVLLGVGSAALFIIYFIPMDEFGSDEFLFFALLEAPDKAFLVSMYMYVPFITALAALPLLRKSSGGEFGVAVGGQGLINFVTATSIGFFPGLFLLFGFLVFLMAPVMPFVFVHLAIMGYVYTSFFAYGVSGLPASIELAQGDETSR